MKSVSQHRMVIGRIVIPMKPHNKKIVKFIPKPRVWKLKDEETGRLFTHEMAARNDVVTKADDIQKKWLLMKETWLKASKVCGINERYVTKPGGNLNRLKIKIL